jgi:hypothetical protein
MNRRGAKLNKLLFPLVLIISLVSCGYRMTGSTYLPFDSVRILPVKNMTYEPRLEDIIHESLAREFINQGIEIRAGDADAELETVIRSFQLGAIAAINEKVKEQELFMKVDFRLKSGGEVMEFRSIQSPIKITFQTAGSVTRSVSEKEVATAKACREVAREIVSRIILSYAK